MCLSIGTPKIINFPFVNSLFLGVPKGLGSIRGVFGPMSKISFTLSNYTGFSLTQCAA